MAFNINKLTVKAQEVIQNSIEIAQNYDNQLIEPEHIFAAMIQDNSNVAVSLIQKIGGNINQFKLQVVRFLEKLPKVTGAGIGSQQLSPNSGKLLEASSEEAKFLKDEYVSTEHILIALTKDSSSVGKYLNDNGITKEEVLTALKDIRGTQRVTNQNP